ncbi:hypothetical protein Hanom_Chr12g01079871 [Helianthus anomalus]
MVVFRWLTMRVITEADDGGNGGEVPTAAVVPRFGCTTKVMEVVLVGFRVSVREWEKCQQHTHLVSSQAFGQMRLTNLGQMLYLSSKAKVVRGLARACTSRRSRCGAWTVVCHVKLYEL